MKKKLLRTFRENGFLLFLFATVSLVALSTIFIVTKEVDKPEDNKDMLVLEDKEKEGETASKDKSKDKVEEDPDDTLEATTKDDLKAEEEEIKKSEEELEKDIAKEEKVEEQEEIEFLEDEPVNSNQGFLWPISGEVITVFTTDSLIYSETLDEWRGHSGIDIKADQGAKVQAVKDGIVKEVREDDLWGISIVIDHGNGIETKYANLGTKEMVREGIEVKQGDHISTVGKTANVEMLMGSHLHFEATKDGKLVDPRSILD